MNVYVLRELKKWRVRGQLYILCRYVLYTVCIGPCFYRPYEFYLYLDTPPYTVYSIRYLHSIQYIYTLLALATTKTRKKVQFEIYWRLSVLTNNIKLYWYFQLIMI